MRRVPWRVETFSYAIFSVYQITPNTPLHSVASSVVQIACSSKKKANRKAHNLISKPHTIRHAVVNSVNFGPQNSWIFVESLRCESFCDELFPSLCNENFFFVIYNHLTKFCVQTNYYSHNGLFKVEATGGVSVRFTRKPYLCILKCVKWLRMSVFEIYFLPIPATFFILTFNYTCSIPSPCSSG